MILILLSLIIILTYVGIMIYKNKSIPYSISDTFYSLEHKDWFGFSMVATALSLMPSILDFTPGNYQFLAFLMCAGLIFVGAAPNFKKGIDRPVHIAGASIAGLCSQIWVILTQPYALFLWIPFLIGVGIKMKKGWDGNLWSSLTKCKPLFWSEAIAFTTTYIALLSKL